ncbi:MAG: nitrite/sulfite reductase [Myxococcales bacterium]
MAEIEIPNELGDGRLGFASEAEVDRFVDTLEKFESGELGPDAWRAFRLVHGVYGQRQDGPMMVRVKIPEGVLTAPQIVALADVAENWSTGKGHVTTRQNVQFHFVKMDDVEAVLRRLADYGLTTREACGNSVRNITACPYAGVSATEAFDVTPYGEALTRHLLRGPLSSSLPRKFKIALGGCCEMDCVGAGFNDIGLLARVQGGKRGFRVTIGGGLSTVRRQGFVAHEFAPVEEVFDIADAVVRVFNRTGNRKRKDRARLKFVIDNLGQEGFLAEYRKEREAIAAAGGTPLDNLPTVATIREKPSRPFLPSPGFGRFLEKNVRAQKQPGLVSVTIRLTLGDITAAQLRVLARLAQDFSGEEQVRTTIDQNLLLRFVRRDSLPALHTLLDRAGLATPGAGTVADVTSCPGAMSCKIAVTASRGVASLVTRELEAAPALAAKAESLSIKVSGCPNGCGQHYVAGIGLQGSVRKIGGRPVPQYHLYVGGGAKAEHVSFGRLAAKVPARRAGQAVARLIELYSAEKKDGEAPDDFFARVAVQRVSTLLADLEDLNEATATADDFIDLGETKAFEVVLQEGECAA